jgi:hypothetical protein
MILLKSYNLTELLEFIIFLPNKLGGGTIHHFFKCNIEGTLGGKTSHDRK